MKRRTLLAGSMAGAALSLWPGWLRRAFAEEESMGGEYRSALRKARELGKPLLVLIIPEEARKGEVGHAFGELLNHGGKDLHAALALVEVVAAGRDLLAGAIPASGRAPLMALVDPQTSPATTVLLDAELPALFDYRRRGNDKDEAVLARRLEVLRGLLLETAGLGKPAVVAGLARAARAHLSREDLHQVEQYLAGRGLLPLPLADRAAALLAERGRPGDLALLVEAAQARLVKERIPGSHWARSSGCGTEIEGEADQLHVKCGMGHVPAQSQRFLYLYAQTTSQQYRQGK